MERLSRAQRRSFDADQAVKRKPVTTCRIEAAGVVDIAVVSRVEAPSLIGRRNGQPVQPWRILPRRRRCRAVGTNRRALRPAYADDVWPGGRRRKQRPAAGG